MIKPFEEYRKEGIVKRVKINKKAKRFREVIERFFNK